MSRSFKCLLWHFLLLYNQNVIKIKVFNSCLLVWFLFSNCKDWLSKIIKNSLFSKKITLRLFDEFLECTLIGKFFWARGQPNVAAHLNINIRKIRYLKTISKNIKHTVDIISITAIVFCLRVTNPVFLYKSWFHKMIEPWYIFLGV